MAHREKLIAQARESLKFESSVTPSTCVEKKSELACPSTIVIDTIEERRQKILDAIEKRAIFLRG